MATPRRRVLRPTRPATAIDQQQQARVAAWQKQLRIEQATMKRGMTKLERLLHSIEKIRRRVARLEARIKAANDTPAVSRG